jgi:hypothetical protein
MRTLRSHISTARVVVIVAVAIPITAIVIWTSSLPGPVVRMTRCVEHAGYSTYGVHDSGLVPEEGQDPDIASLLADSNGMIRVHDPVDTVHVLDRQPHKVATEVGLITMPAKGPNRLAVETRLGADRKDALRSCARG